MRKLPPDMYALRYWGVRNLDWRDREELGVYILLGEGNNHCRLIVSIKSRGGFFCFLRLWMPDED